MKINALKTDEQVIMSAVMRRVVVDKFQPFLSKRGDNPLLHDIDAGDVADMLEANEFAVRKVVDKYARGGIGAMDFRDIMIPLVGELTEDFPCVRDIYNGFVDRVNEIACVVRGVIKGTVDRAEVDSSILNLVDLARAQIVELRKFAEDGGASLVKPDSHGDSPRKLLKNQPLEVIQRVDGGNVFKDPGVRARFNDFAHQAKLPDGQVDLYSPFLDDPSVLWLTYDEIADVVDRERGALSNAALFLRRKGFVVSDVKSISNPGFYLLTKKEARRGKHGAGRRLQKYTVVYAMTKS